MVIFRVTIFSRWTKLLLTSLLYQNPSHPTRTMVMFRVNLCSRWSELLLNMLPYRHPSHLARFMVLLRVTFCSRLAEQCHTTVLYRKLRLAGLLMPCNIQEVFSPIFLLSSPTPTIFPNTSQLFFGVWAFEHRFSLKINVQSEQLCLC